MNELIQSNSNEEEQQIQQTQIITLGGLPVSPEKVVERASEIATALAGIVDSRKLYKFIGGKKYVLLEGWSTLGAMLGVLPVEEWVRPIEGGFEAYVTLIRTRDGLKIGGASAMCTEQENNWRARDKYAIRSMAITRAAGKAFRLAFSWIIQLAGYEPTPAEEMVNEEGHPGSQQPPTPVQNRPSRPYPPQVLKERLATVRDMALRNGYQVRDNAKQIAAINLEECFRSSDPTYCRRVTTWWLTGHESLKELDEGWLYALLKWLNPRQEDGNWSPDPIAVLEAQAAYTEAERAKGQLEFNLKGE